MPSDRMVEHTIHVEFSDHDGTRRRWTDRFTYPGGSLHVPTIGDAARDAGEANHDLHELVKPLGAAGRRVDDAAWNLVAAREGELLARLLKAYGDATGQDLGLLMVEPTESSAPVITHCVEPYAPSGRQRLRGWSALAAGGLGVVVGVVLAGCWLHANSHGGDA